MKKTSKTPLISVIIPFFNTGLSLEGLIKQISRICPDAEIICVDDKSTDGSLARIKKLANDKVHVIAQKKNQGSAAARNRGITEAKGKYIVFLDSDDFVRDDFFEKMLSCINEAVLGVCGIRQIFLKDNKFVDKFTKEPKARNPKDNWREYILKSMFNGAELYSSVNKIYLGDVIRENNLRFDEKLNFAEDTKFVLDYLACFDDDAKINFVCEPLYFYNYGTNTSVVADSSLHWKNWQKSYDDIIAWLGRESDGGSRVISRRELRLAKKLRTRFKISHLLAVARSKKSREEKLKYVNKFELLLGELALKIR